MMYVRISFFLVMVFHILDISGQTTRTVGSTGADFPTLKEAFDAINSGSLTGSLILRIINSTSETATATLNASGVNQAQYTSVLIYPSASGIRITGTLNLPLIRLDGADNLTLDGRVNLSGESDLVISNTSTETSASTFQFIGGASDNTIRYCRIHGSTRNSAGGVIHFSTTTTTGNISNKVEYCKISKSETGNPIHLIYSYGTSSKDNSGFIRYNFLYDYCSTSGTSYAILISSGNTAWEVSFNSIYQTAPVPAANFTLGGIFLAGGAGHSIHDNYIGGGSPEAGDPKLTTIGSGAIRFIGISMNVFTSTATNVYNNVIRNINWISSSGAVSSSGLWTGYYLQGGLIHFGNLGGNIIGQESGTNNITVTTTSSSNVAGSYGILTASAGTGTIQICNNKIGSVTLNNTSSSLSSGHRFYGIFAQIGSPTITNNQIGSLDTPRSIQSINSQSNGTSANSQDVTGILVTYSGANPIVISGNNIENLYNGWKVAGSQFGLVRGIHVSAGTGSLTVSDNVISGLTSMVPNSGTGNYTSLAGILISSSPSSLLLYGNQIDGLENQSASASIVHVGGVLLTGNTGNGQIRANRITGLSSYSQAPGGGMLSGLCLTGGNHQVDNNLIMVSNNTLNNPATIRGIWDAAGSSFAINYYFNSIKIGGSQSSGTNADSYAFYRSAATSNILKNNIFTNFRESNISFGKSYAVSISDISGNMILDYNDYYSGSSNGIMALFGTTEIESLPIVLDQDLSSASIDPVFSGATGLQPTRSELNNQGLSVAGITTDHEGSVRNEPPDIGALEFALTADISLSEPEEITSTSALFRGIVNPNNETASGVFEYGTTTTYGNSTAWFPFSVSGLGDQMVEAQVSSLIPNTLYHFRLVATTPAGSISGEDQSFQTQPASQSTFISGEPGLWSDRDNWDMGVPGEITNAVISGGKEVIVNELAICNDLTIQPLGALSVVSDNRLQVNGNLIVDSDETGTGSLIAAANDLEVGGTTEVLRYFSGAPESWHFLSSPVVNQQITGEFTPAGNYPDGTGYDFYLWQESTGVWMNQKAATWFTANGGDIIQPGRGYLVAYQESNPVRHFTGIPFSGDISIPMTYAGTTPYRYFNLAGNPYVSAIDWKKSTGIDKTALYIEPGGGHTIYIYNGTAGNYGVYHDMASGDLGTNGVGRYIPPMQGFFVRARAEAQPCTMVITNEARVHHNQPWLKSSQAPGLSIRVVDSYSGLSDELLLEFGHTSAAGGAEKWHSLNHLAPSLFFTRDEKKYSLAFMDSICIVKDIYISFKAGKPGNFLLKCKLNELPGVTIYLDDLQTGREVKCSPDCEYHFYGTPADQEKRFRIRQAPQSVTLPSENNSFSFSYRDKILTIHSQEINHQTEGCSFFLFNLSGRLEKQEFIRGTFPHRLEIDLPAGIYLIRLVMDNCSYSGKVIAF